MASKSWHELLVEIIAKDESDSEPFCSSNNGRHLGIYFFDNSGKAIYFTHREARCMLHLLRRKNFGGVAKKLKLSPYTVEFYVNNMCRKLDCNSISDLIAVVKSSDFLKHYRRKMFVNQKSSR